jgi:NAD(P)-dependent dehydrogenase (short-subunit alcohol dehydrogenase family)
MSERGGDSRLAGRVVIVTGASRGIGAAIARLMASEGAQVAVAARTLHGGQAPGSAEEVASGIGAAGGRAIAVRCDVTDEDDRIALVETVRRQLGPIDVLVNNAAAFGTLSLADMSLGRFRVCFEVNVFAPYRLMQLVTPEMAQRRRGWIVNITSDASRRPGDGPFRRAGPGASGYGSSKAALEMLTRSVAQEMGEHGLAVNALMPSMPVPTPSMLAHTPQLDEMVTEESFAEATLRLAVADPSTTNGKVLYSEDVLHPELGTRGWLASV